jgi:hypoxanthine-DNA glycosylase
MTRIHGFPPSADKNARTLILGSMPGAASLAAAEYYAHPRNAFWGIMSRLYGIETGLPYRERLLALRGQGVALWDVIAGCVRQGSLDAAIDDASVVPNDFAAFLVRHPRITRVYFNGARAEQAWRKFVLPRLPPRVGPVVCARLPSTSPANASWSAARKLAAWRQILD